MAYVLQLPSNFVTHFKGKVLVLVSATVESVGIPSRNQIIEILSVKAWQVKRAGRDASDLERTRDRFFTFRREQS